jgi:hypothetical protein
MFKYIARNNEQFGFRNIDLKGRITACHFTTGTADFTSSATSPKRIAYTLIIHQPDARDEESVVPGELRLVFYVIIALLEERFPKKTLSSSHDSEGSDFDDQMTALLQNAELRLQRALELALRFYARDSLWRRLIAPTDNRVQIMELSAEDVMVMSTRYNTRPLTTFDAEISDIWTLSLEWDKLLDFLGQSYGSYSRHFREKRSPTHVRHLILLNSQNSDLLVHFAVDSERNNITADLVSREKETSTNADTALVALESEFVAEAVRTISRFLWYSAVH